MWSLYIILFYILLGVDVVSASSSSTVTSTAAADSPTGSTEEEPVKQALDHLKQEANEVCVLCIICCLINEARSKSFSRADQIAISVMNNNW